MQINVLGGVGEGPTELAAFDAALMAIGVANFNLLPLSSVIPAGSQVDTGQEVPRAPGAWGDRLYVVMAEDRTATPNAEVWAGLGWVQDANTGHGLFVEHHGGSRSEVERDIRSTLDSMVSSRGDRRFGPVEMLIKGTVCVHEPVCAVVVATYATAAWR